MVATVVAGVASTLAVVAAIARLRVVSRASGLDYDVVTNRLAGRAPADMRRLAASISGEGLWESEVLEVAIEAPSYESARARANEILFDVEEQLSWGSHIPAACARAALFVALLAGAMVVGREARLTNEVIDVVAIGAGGAMATLAAGAEARRRAKAVRVGIDRWVDRVMLVCWPAAAESDSEAMNAS